VLPGLLLKMGILNDVPAKENINQAPASPFTPKQAHSVATSGQNTHHNGQAMTQLFVYRICASCRRFVTDLLNKRVWSIYFSFCYAVSILVLTGIVSEPGRWYSPSPHFRAQTEALMHGRLALSNNPNRLDHDLCWSEHGVHQVWGLGIPLWRLPWEAAARILGQQGFPDWLALGIWMAVFAYAVLQVIGKMGMAARQKQIISVDCLGAVLVLLLFPPILSLLRTRMNVYDEVLVYVYFFGLGLLALLTRWSQRPSSALLWGLCLAAGLGGLLRPTLFFYGLAAVFLVLAVVSAKTFLQNGKVQIGWRCWCAMGLFVLGGTTLWLTNLCRFGNGFEFGHTLNLQGGSLLGSIFATRFDYPFQAEPVWRAAKELFGSLFLVQRFNGPDWYASHLYLGQSPTIRWREFYLETFDLSYVPLILAGWWIGLYEGCKWWQTQRPASANSGACPWATIISGWSFISTLLLALFYLRTPAISSRYTMDFAPAFAAAVLVFWRGIQHALGNRQRSARYSGWVSLLALLAWIGMGVAKGSHNFYGSPDSITWQNVQSHQTAVGLVPSVPALPNAYARGQNLKAFNIPFNGSGWNLETGTVQVSVILFVDSPDYLEIDFEAAAGATLTSDQLSLVRAKVGTEFLKKEAQTPIDNGWRIRFAGPQQSRYQRGLQPVFLAMVGKEHLADERTPLVMKRMTWRQ